MSRPRVGSPENIAMIRDGQRRARARMAAGEGFIYVAEVVGTGNVKIGFSLNPGERLRWLTKSHRLMGAFPASRAEEHAFHKAMQRALGLPKRTEVYSRSALAHAQRQPRRKAA